MPSSTYDKDYIKQFIKEFHNVDLIPEVEDDEDDFFSLDKGSTLNMDETLRTMQTADEIVYFSELLDYVDEKCTDKEMYVFMLRSSGKTLEQIGAVFELSKERIRQILEDVLEKICE